MMAAYLGVLLNNTIVSYAGSNTTFSVFGGKVRTSHVNQYFTALNEDFVPRNSSGVPTDEGGNLGTSVYSWKNAEIAVGYWGPGDIKCKHTYDGLLSIEQGWMRMDGDIVNETNYDAEHSAGDWAFYIGSSPLDGKYLPNVGGTYILAVADTTQDGSSPIASVGNTSHQINIQHSHSIPAIQWYDDDLNTEPNNLYNSSGVAENITIDESTSEIGVAVGFCDDMADGTPGAGNHGCIGNGDRYTTTSTTGNNLSSTQNIQPESKEFVCYMRII